MKYRTIFTLSLFVSLLVLPFSGFADNHQAHSKKKELPKSGSLSMSGSFGGGKVVMEPAWGSDTDSSADAGAPISGSVARLNERNWEARIINNSKKSYAVDLEMLQYDQKGSTVKRDSFSYTLKPGQTQARTVSASLNSTAAELKLSKWKSLGDKAKKESQEKVSDSESETEKSSE